MGVGQNALIISVVMSLFLFLGGVKVFDSGHDPMAMFVQVDANNNPTAGSSLGNLPQNSQINPVQPVTNSVTSSGWVDGLGSVWNVILGIFNILTAELALFKFVGIAPAFIFLVAIPLIALKVLAVLSFIRGVMW
jgi:hypothetical protein